MRLISKTDSRANRSSLQECLLTCKLMTSQGVQWLLLQMVTKLDFSNERVNQKCTRSFKGRKVSFDTWIGQLGRSIGKKETIEKNCVFLLITLGLDFALVCNVQLHIILLPIIFLFPALNLVSFNLKDLKILWPYYKKSKGCYISKKKLDFCTCSTNKYHVVFF